MSALFDQSYQPWVPHFQPHPMRTLAIVVTGSKNIIRRHPLALLILTGIAILFSLPSAFLGMVVPFPLEPAFLVSSALSSSMSWTYLLVLPLVGSGLIASDIRHNALLMYFSKSIYRADYLVGKNLIAFIFLVLPLLLAPLTAGAIAVYNLKESATTVYSARLFLGLFLCVPVALLPGIAINLAFSSCTKRNFLAGVGWVVLHLVLETVSAILSNGAKLKYGYLFSISNNVFRVAKEILPGPPPDFPKSEMSGEIAQATALTMGYSAWWSAAILAGIFAASMAIIVWRLSSVDRRT